MIGVHLRWSAGQAVANVTYDMTGSVSSDKLANITTGFSFDNRDKLEQPSTGQAQIKWDSITVAAVLLTLR